MPYAWDNPADKTKALIVSINGREREVNLAELGPSLPFKYPLDQGNRSGIMAIHVAADGPQFVLKLSPYDEKKSMFRTAGSRRGSVTAAAGKEEFEVVRALQQIAVFHSILMHVLFSLKSNLLSRLSIKLDWRASGCLSLAKLTCVLRRPGLDNK